MESKVDYTESPPSYTPSAPSQYQTAYPAPAPGPSSYPPPGHQQYPPPSQYLPATAPAPYGQQDGYDQRPPAVYQQQRQQQQQQVVVVRHVQQNHVILLQQVPTYTLHLTLACIVFWSCNPLFGLIAFVLSGWFSCIAVNVIDVPYSIYSYIRRRQNATKYHAKAQIMTKKEKINKK